MGLLKHLLSWPVTAPLALAEFSMRQVEGVAKRELTDDTAAKEELMLLHMALEEGEIGLEEHGRREAELMQRLRDAREWRTKLGMEEEWAPLGARPSGASADGDGPAPGGAGASGGSQGP